MGRPLIFGLLSEDEFRELHVRLLVFAKRRVGASDAEDVVQETYLRVLNGRRTYKGHAPQTKSELEQLLVQTAKSLCSHVLRK